MPSEIVKGAPKYSKACKDVKITARITVKTRPNIAGFL